MTNRSALPATIRPAAMTATVVVIFALVYLGMILGEIPGLAMDRTGIALLGAIALMVTEALSPEEARRAIDAPTLSLLFGLMVVSAQLRLSGFYAALTRRLASLDVSPRVLLAVLVAVAGVLSALLTNDVVCLAVTPVLVEGCTRRGLNPLPFLLALACAANVGSAATLIGNPQNMLIGQRLGLSFAGYLLDGGVPAALGLVAVWAVVAARYTGRWSLSAGDPPPQAAPAPPLDRWQAGKGLAVLAALVVAFLFTSWPRDVLALAAAGVLLLSRRTASREALGRVDWQLLVLFVGLFVVNRAVARHGVLDRLIASIGAAGVDPARPAWLFALAAALSNVVSNVPAVMLLLPVARHPLAGPILALSSTLAGNLFLVGSIANLIVAKEAEPLGVRLTWRAHARVGVPVTLATLAIAAGWLWLRARWMPLPG